VRKAEALRLFVAMDLTEQVRAYVREFCEKLRHACPAAKWARVEGMHVTLKFIGEARDENVNAIRSALARIHSPAPVHMAFRGAGFFPSAKRPRVFWVGIAASPNLSEISKEIEQGLIPLGIEPEKREFHPHLTLARLETHRGLDPLHDALRQARDPDFGSVQTHEFHLYQSELLRGGAQYTKLQSFPFAAGGSA
jgi:RNA 2',3'-cyclic 3'-phosphodiesterase